jgi:hypothetical protein
MSDLESLSAVFLAFARVGVVVFAAAVAACADPPRPLLDDPACVDDAPWPLRMPLVEQPTGTTCQFVSDLDLVVLSPCTSPAIENDTTWACVPAWVEEPAVRCTSAPGALPLPATLLITQTSAVLDLGGGCLYRFEVP